MTAVVLTEPGSARRWSERERCLGHTVALVPTMGALHAGHVALIDRAREVADRVVVSIFVNPMQFDRPDDFDGYPRPIEDDVAICESAGVDAIFAPTAAVMYPVGFDTRVEPGDLAARFEGAGRPGHFTGVTTVVTKLFAATRPDLAVFGEKDAQQLAIVRRLARDLDLGVEVVAVPTVREPDGLALSSRNRRLPPDDRAAAVCISSGLDAAEHRFLLNGATAAELTALVRDRIDAEPRARSEYVRVVHPDRFVELDGPVDDGLVVVAAWFGPIRLIDNRRLRRPG